MHYYDITIIYGTSKKLRTFEDTLRAKNCIEAIKKALNSLFIEKGVQDIHIKQTLVTEV